MVVLTKNGTVGRLDFAYPGETEVVGKIFRVKLHNENGYPITVKDEIIEILE